MVYTNGMEERSMPWKEIGVMDERMRLVLAVEEGESVSEAAHRFGVSRVTAHKWLGRFKSAGVLGLQDASRAPHSHPNAVAEHVIARVVALRREHPTWGALKLYHWLESHESNTAWPAPSTIALILKEHGLTGSFRRRRVARYSEPLAHCDGPNRVWCADFKGWFLTGDGLRCDPLTISDGFSRYLLRCQALAHPTYEAVRPLFEATFREYGLPLAMRTDNGTPFAGTRGLGLSRLSVWWIKLGITPERIAPGKPQQNGRHERMHRTLKAQTLNPPAETLRKQQRRFDKFRREYNEERPHQALGHKPPVAYYSAASRQYTSRIHSPDYPKEWTVRRVYEKGSFYWNGALLFISDALRYEYVALAPSANERYLTIHYGHVPIAYLDTKHACIRAQAPKAVRDEKEKER